MTDLAAPPNPVGITLFVDANTLAFGAAARPPSYGLADLVRSLPEGARSFLGWVPNVTVDVVALTFDPASMSFSVYGTAGLADSATPSASLLVASTEVPDGQPGAGYVVAVTLDSSIELGGVPLFGSMLDGISVRNLQFSYASRSLPAGTISLPPPAPAPPPFAQGPQLCFVLSDGTNEETFTLTPSGPSSTTMLGDPPAGPPIQWFDVQRTIGPLTIARIGVMTGDDELGIALDASLRTVALSVDLTGFTLGFSPTSDISLHGLRISLDGLGVSFTSSTVQIVGSLARTVVQVDDQPVTEYNGAIMIQAGVYGIAAIGSFASLDGHPSLFVFGMAKGQFGGPPAFFVTGLAAGFGVNRGLRLPTPDQVKEFPFVLMATMGQDYLPDPGTTSALSKLTEGGWVPPELGSYWLVAGIRFTSFQLLQAFALLIVRFGNEFVVALLGVASISLPKGIGKPYAYAELTLDAVLDPRQGTFQMTALLTPNSFVLHPDCQLTGGFAFYLWFGDNDHAGDFVVTLGGYHPAFSKPDWYPQVPRLGITWKVSSQVQISGGAYLALTPGCVMAGGALSVRFTAGNLKAWFDAHADFIIFWQPFFFDVSVGVSIGASYTLDLGFVRKTFTVSLDADVELWGPPLAGIAHVNWWVISFTIPINGGHRPKLPGNVIDWAAFQATFLPAQPDTEQSHGGSSDPQPPANTTICLPRAAAGLVATTDQDGVSTWQVVADEFVLATETLIPATTIIVDGPTPGTTLTYDGPPINAYPLGNVTLRSVHHVQVHRADDTASRAPQDLSAWSWAPATTSVPSAMWGPDNTGSAQLSAETVPALTGISGTPPDPASSGPPTFDIAALTYVDLKPRPLPLDRTPHDGSTPRPKLDPRTVIRDTIATAPVVATRSAIADALRLCGVGTDLTGGQLTDLADDLDLVLPQDPMLGPIGTTGPRPTAPGPTTPGPAVPAAVTTEPHPGPVTTPSRPAAPRVVAVFHRTGRTLRGLRVGAHATAPDRQDVLALTAAGVDPGLPVSLHPGATVVWDVRAVLGRQLHTVGELPVRALSFDRCDRLVGDVTMVDADQVQLPEQAARVALVTGWHAPGWVSSEELMRLGAQALLAGSLVVRPQAPQPLHTGRRSRLGVLDTQQLAAQNRVLGLTSQHRGWLDCWVPARTSQVEVTVARDGDGDGARGRGTDQAPTDTLIWVAHGWDPDASLDQLGWHLAEPADPVWNAGLAGTRATRLSTLIPRSDQSVRVRLQTAPGWLVAGVVPDPPMVSDGRRQAWPEDQAGTARPGKVAARLRTRVSLR